jgi:hypothetical protein
MKKILALSTILFTLSSCKDYWPQEDKDAYHKTCMDDAKMWTSSEAEAKTYCDCVLDKITTKYKTVEELMEHMHEVATYPDIQQCKSLVPEKPKE